MKPVAWTLAAGVLAAIAAAGDAGRVDELARTLEQVRVSLPGGGEAAVVGPDDALLDRSELATCLQTVDEAEAWPALWLVIQREGAEHDLVMRLEQLDAPGIVADFVFATARREWQPGDVRRLARERVGRKPPRQGLHNLVVQGFSTRVEHVYRYRPAGSDKGLGALLPEGSMIRESRRVDLGTERLLTLALVIEQGSFRPSDCSTCEAVVFGHADSGRVSLVLADEREVVDRLDLGEALVPRFACEEGDDGLPRDETTWQRLSSRPGVPLLTPVDHDGDGRALEVALPEAMEGCDAWIALIVGVDAESNRLEVVGRDRRVLP